LESERGKAVLNGVLGNSLLYFVNRGKKVSRVFFVAVVVNVKVDEFIYFYLKFNDHLKT
jgi:hypothetical protein